MGRLIVLLLVIGALAIFVLQNMPPIALVFLGIPIPALPLGFWIVGSIAAGAFTTLVIAGLVNLSRPASASRREATRRSSFSAGSPGPAWNAGWAKRSDQSTQASNRYASNSSGSRNTGDDWETSSKTKEEWEDWEDYQEPTDRRASYQSAPQTEVRDREDESWSDWEGYENTRESAREPVREPVNLDDEPRDRSSVPPHRTDFEVKQEPATQQQSGSVYSYSYRRSEQAGARKPEDGVRKPENVYDADYRVITPPYRPDPEEVEPAEYSGSEDDWDFEADEPGRDRRDFS